MAGPVSSAVRCGFLRHAMLLAQRCLPMTTARKSGDSVTAEVSSPPAGGGSFAAAEEAARAAGSAPSAAPGSSQQEAQRLAEAFHIFNQASEELSSAYTGLQRQVAELTSELAAANGALRQQYQEKAALTERLSLLLDALPAGVIVLDAQGRVMQNNPTATCLLPGLAAGTSWLEVDRQLVVSETPGEYLTSLGRRVALTVTELDSAGGRIVLLHDVSEAHQLKTQAERNQRLAAMGEMAAQLAHQLRTPLAAALLYTGNLENPALPVATRTSIAAKAVARLKHLEHLIQDTLMFARGEVLGREPIDVAELLQDLQQTMEPLARQRGVTFRLLVDAPGASQAGAAPLQGNRKALMGALTNLLENALHAAAGQADGQVLLAAHLGAQEWQFVVHDNGPGMSAELVDRVFEPFFTTRSEGTGLGLAIARGVVRAHHGELEVSSTPGQGTEFRLHLPLSSASAVDG